MRARDVGVTTLALLATAVVVAACGGGSHSTATTPTKPTAPTARTLFIARADAICQQSRASLAQLRAQAPMLAALGDSAKGYALAAALFRRVRYVEAVELNRLKALTLPGGDSSRATGYLQEGAKAVALVGRLAHALAARDKTAVVAIGRAASQVTATARGLAQGYGFKVCGGGGNGLT